MRFGDIEAELASDDDEVRRRAVIAIGERAELALHDPLLRGLGDESWRVREEAVRVASERSEELKLLPALVEAICQGANVGLRNAAIATLGNIGGAACDELVAALPRVQPGAVKFVLEALGEVGGDAASAVLVEQLGSEDPNNVAAAIEALAGVGGARAETALRARLTVADPFVRMAALDALNRMEVVLPWEALQPLLADPLLRGVLLPALGRCGDPRAVDYLVGTLERVPERPAERACVALLHLCQASAEALQRVRGAMLASEPAPWEGLSRLATDGEPPASTGAVLLLCLAQRPEVIPGLLESAWSSEPGPELLQAMASWGEQLVDLLFEHAARRDAPRAAVALTLAADLARDRWRDDEPASHAPRARVRAELRAALGASDAELSIAAARSLAVWGEAADAASLVAAAEGGGEMLVAACKRGLLSLSERAPDAVRDAIRRVDLGSELGTALTDLIVELEGQAALPRLRDVLLTGAPSARAAAVLGLSVLGGAAAAELIALSLTDESMEVQLAAAECLGRVTDADGEPLGVEALLLSLDGSPAELQAAVARALGLTGTQRAVALLQSLAEHADAAVRVAALEALSDLGAPDIDGLLLQALAHQDSELVKHALGRISLDSPPCLRAAIALLSHERWDVRQLAVRVLGARSEDEVHDALARRMQQESDELVLAALGRALGDGAGQATES